MKLFKRLFTSKKLNKAKYKNIGKKIDDTVITANIKTAIFNEPDLQAFNINIITKAGVSQLMGIVASKANKKKATAIAETIRGVNGVNNELTVKIKV